MQGRCAAPPQHPFCARPAPALPLHVACRSKFPSGALDSHVVTTDLFFNHAKAAWCSKGSTPSLVNGQHRLLCRLAAA